MPGSGSRPACRVVVRAAALVVALAATGAAEAAELPPGTVTIDAENDRIARTDRHYTHGTRLSWVSDKTTGGPAWIRETLETLYPLADVRGGRIGFALGQNMYTPEDTDARSLVTDDRPYAGWLYGAVSLHAEATRTVSGIELDTLDSVELNLGVVGPASLAEPTQNTVHDLIGVSRSRGWGNQLDNEPAVALFFERRWRPVAYQLFGLEADAIPYAGGSLGNVFTMLDAGLMVRLGQDIGRDYGPPHIRPTLSAPGTVDPGWRLGWYVFAGAEARSVLRNIFLDGNTFTDSHSVDRKVWVGDFHVGFAVMWHGVRLAFTHVYRTREFDSQSEPDRFGTASVSFRF